MRPHPLCKASAARKQFTRKHAHAHRHAHHLHHCSSACKALHRGSPFRGFGYRAAFCRVITINYHTLCDISGPLSRFFFIRRSGLMFGKVARRLTALCGGFGGGYPAIPSKWPGSGLQVNRGQNFILSFMTAAVTREFSCSHARKSGGKRTLRGRFALGRADFILGHLNKRH